jgi:hypothetical protein
VKFSYRQILASAVGAVLSAIVASIFGVKGTIVGVAIGSIAATTGTALVFQSIERTNKAVKQVVVRVPETSLLRRLGGTNAAGSTESTSGESSAPTEETTTSAALAPAGTGAATASEPAVARPMGSTSEPPEPPESPETVDVPGAGDGADRSGGIPWTVVVLTVIGVFLFSLLFVTVVELIAGRPLADLFGHGGGGTTVERIFENTPTTLPPPTTTTSTTTTSTTTSTSTTIASSSTTTSVGGSTTTSTGVGSTSTTSPSSATTTTTVSGTTSP